MSIFTKTGYRKKYLLTHPWELIFHYGRDLKCAWERARKGYCFRDLWNIDLWFIQLMPQMLQEFKKNMHGYPTCFETSEEWEKVLDNMIFCFNEANEETCSLQNEYDYNCDFDFIPTENNFSELSIIYPTEKDEQNSKLYYEKECELEKYREEKLHEGLQLFAKYFHNLWN